MLNIPITVQQSLVRMSNISVIPKEFALMLAMELVHVEETHVIVGLDIVEPIVLHRHDYHKDQSINK